MRTSLKILIGLVIILIAGGGGLYFGYKGKFFKTYETEKTEVIMERVAKVFKMVAVEGYVSEIYDYKQYKYWDINFLRKKAMVRVKAKVSVGYDFEKATFEVDEENKEILIKGFPDPEILSIDHDLDYYDMEEGLFNSFNESELTDMNIKAKRYAKTMIEDGVLFDEARLQKDKIITLLEDLLKPSGWKVRVLENKSMMKD